MVAAFRLTGRAFQLWWHELFMLTFFNIAWLALQIPLVTGPPATAAMYVIAGSMADGDSLYPLKGWAALRRMFLPAIRWGVMNFIIILVVVGNFWAYRAQVGAGWTILRFVWGMISVAWFGVNLFYWPFWLAQEQRSTRITLRNALLFHAKNPGFAMTLTLISALLIVVSVLTTLPLAVALMAWLSLIGVLAIGEELG
jgi:hypothetical protein